MLNKVLIVDFGSQVTQLIARSVRSQKVYCEVVPYNKVSLNFIKKEKPLGIILSGSPLSVTKKGFPKIKKDIFFFRNSYFRNLLWNATYIFYSWRKN